MGKYKCAKCDKDSTKKCGKCQSLYYCSKKCQTAHWKQHKKSCNLLAEVRHVQEETGGGVGDVYVGVGPAGFGDKKPLTIDPSVMALMTNGDTRDIAADYRKSYPDEEKQYQRVKQELSKYRVGQFAKSNNMYSYFDNDELFSDARYNKRWGIVTIEEKEKLENFLSSPRKIGDFFRRKVVPRYEPTLYQTMKNTSTIDHVYEFGKNYVSIGYVDLSPLLWATYRKEECGKPMYYYGYEASLVAALRSKIIYEMLKMDEKEISSSSILQIWFSSCLDKTTISVLHKVLDKMKTDALVLNTPDEELQIIEIWRRNKIPVKKAKDAFSTNLQNLEFDGIWSLKYEVDRIKFLRYLFTGCLFMDVDSAECGNPTMYSKLNGYRKTLQFENFFKSVNLLSSHLMKSTKNCLFEEICSATFGAAQQLRKRLNNGSLICHLFHKNVKMNDLALAKEIHDLNPYIIDWSTVPDYLEKDKFIKFARSCSTDHTIHFAIFINWTNYVFGSEYVDWVNARSKLVENYHHYKSIMSYVFKSTSFESLWIKHGALKFLRDGVYENFINDVNKVLANINRQKFEDFFISDENGLPLNRLKLNSVDSHMPSSLFIECTALFSTTFSFNRNITLEHDTV